MEEPCPGTRITIWGPIARDDLVGLTARVCGELARAGPGASVECDVAGIAADAVSIDALARLMLGARRHGCHVLLRNAEPRLRELAAAMGLAGVLAI